MTEADMNYWAGLLMSKYGIPWPVIEGDDDDDDEEPSEELVALMHKPAPWEIN